MKKIPSYTPVAFAVAALLQAGAAQAQESLKLDEVVVTSSSTAKSKMRSSVSVTDVDQEQIKDFSARTEAEVLLLIPGIRTDATAGPGGNANISVRGLPISDGGSKYVQIQEDGLPTVQFGDMNFGNNDYWTRFDNNVDNIQTLRGGSASTYASHAPGAVINYISKTGKEEGGSIGVTKGLNFNETRIDGNVGGKIGTDMYYHLGGYIREGEGNRNYTPGALQGHQIKANITKEFNGTKGYVRLNVKSLDEHAPTTPQTFLTATKTGSTVGGFGLVPGYDGARDTQYSKYNSVLPGVDPVTGARTATSLLDGITTKSKSVGFEFHNELANGYTVDNKFRISQNSGAFQAQFWDVQTGSKMLSSIDGASVAKYYNGPQAGSVVGADTLVSKGAAINVTSSDMGNIVNDASVAKKFKLDGGSLLDVRGGLFYSRQNVQQRWSISERVMAAGKNGALIDVFDSNGAALTTAGLTGYNNQWGACCSRDINAQFTTTAPYMGFNLAQGNWDFDGGLRRESFSANGTYAGSKKVNGGLDVNKDGLITGAEKNVYLADVDNPGLVNYTINYTNYSFGTNYRLNKDTSVFVRHSKGYRAQSDRLLFSDNIDKVTGALTEGGQKAALAAVQQSEVGVRNRGKHAWGNYAAAATLFRSTTEEYTYDQTRKPEDGPKLNQLGYRANGVELETGASFGNFALNFNAVYTDEILTSNLVEPKKVGLTSGGLPKVRYTISPRYAIGDAVIGAAIRGQSSVFVNGDNTDKINGHYIVSAFANYDFGNGLIGSLNVNNLFNKIYPVAGGGFVGGSTSVFGAGVNTGRTVSATVRYKF